MHGSISAGRLRELDEEAKARRYGCGVDASYSERRDVSDRVSKQIRCAAIYSPRTGRRFDAWVGTRRSGNMPQTFGTMIGSREVALRPTNVRGTKGIRHNDGRLKCDVSPSIKEPPEKCKPEPAFRVTVAQSRASLATDRAANDSPPTGFVSQSRRGGTVYADLRCCSIGHSWRQVGHFHTSATRSSFTATCGVIHETRTQFGHRCQPLYLGALSSMSADNAKSVPRLPACTFIDS